MVANPAYGPDGILRDSVVGLARVVRRATHARFPTWAGNSCEDSIYFNELLGEGCFGFLDEPLVGYRRHPASATQRPGGVQRGCTSLLRWVNEKAPADRDRLKPKLLGALLECMEKARWARNWQKYREFREFLGAHWPADLPRPAALGEFVLPRLAYRLKDLWDYLTKPKADLRKPTGESRL